MIAMKPIISQVKRVMPLSKLVSTRCSAIVPATWPKAVRAPVSTTTPQPTPLTTALPMKQMLGRSNGVSALPAWGSSVLLERHRLAGQRRLVDEEILCRDQPQVGGDHVAGRQQHDVAGNELPDRHIAVPLRVPPSCRRTVALVCTMRRSASAALFERCS